MATLLQTKRLGWAVMFALVTALALLTYVAGKRYLAALAAVEHTQAVESAVSGTLSLLKDAETGQRGYVLTGDAPFLQPYYDSGTKIPPLLYRLERAMEGDATQAQRLSRLRQLIQVKQDFIDATIDRRRHGSLEEALKLVRSGQGIQLMDQIREECRAMLAHEDALLVRRKQPAQRAQTTATLGIGVGTTLMMLLALLSLLTVSRDVNDLKRAAEELAKSEEHYRMLSEQSSDLVRLTSLKGVNIYVSPSVERLLGYTVDEYLKLEPLSLLHPDDLDVARQLLADVNGGKIREGVSTYRIKHVSGEYRWFEVRWAVRRGPSGEPLDLHSTGRDVTERLVAEKRLNAYAHELKILSLRDELTGLYNRRGFLEVAAQAHAVAQREQRVASVVFVDLNGMKRINDELGHDVGDQALLDTAAILTKALRESDVVARLGGDEFVIYALDFGPGHLEQLRPRLRELADQRVSAQKRPFRLSMSVGAAHLLVGEQTTVGELLDRADLAMYQQKNARRAAGGVSLAPPTAGR
jgi:diguanylate cyclase (GGDEF)-like protein/PAS domain S-box-containing protein